ncbi:MAG: hypothetical protein LBI73_00120 [Myroides sp.]|jgi:hypothetical protein|nr:hypothetical protein [Myroides sp.]
MKLTLYFLFILLILFSCKEKSFQTNNKLSLTEKHQEYLKKYYTEDKNVFLDSVLQSFNELIKQNETNNSIYKYGKLSFYLDNNYYKQALEELDNLYPSFFQIDHKLFKIALKMKLNYVNTDKELNNLYQENLINDFEYIEDKQAFILLHYNLYNKEQSLKILNKYIINGELSKMDIQRLEDIKILIDQLSPKEALFHHFYIDN